MSEALSTANGAVSHETTVPRLVMLSRDKPVAWMVMPELLERVKAFCIANDQDSEPTLLAESIMRDFTQDPGNRGFGIIVAIQDGRVVGHLLAELLTYCQRRFVNVLQYSLDRRHGIPQGLLQGGFKMLEEWGNLNMAVQIRAQVPTEAHARRLRTFYGFKPHRVLMRKDI